MVRPLLCLRNRGRKGSPDGNKGKGDFSGSGGGKGEVGDNKKALGAAGDGRRGWGGCEGLKFLNLEPKQLVKLNKLRALAEMPPIIL